ncbi:MAG: S8 family serine peptidase [Candidatus Buchananbacteria bacterium]|nr:S8 family serine peptidase [Candidatus Buchananbacteria bacterium]
MRFLLKTTSIVALVAMSIGFGLPTAAMTPIDPLYPEQDYLQRLNVPAAWDQATGEGVVVAVIDSGIDATHPELAPNLWRNSGEVVDGVDNDGNGFVDDVNGWDFLDDDPDPTPVLERGYDAGSVSHGTAISGLIAARANNNEGIIGVAWGARIMALRSLNVEGTGNINKVVEAIEYAVANGADIINLSLVGYTRSGRLEAALEDAASRGVLVVAAAGNGTAVSRGGVNLDAQPGYPVCYGGADNPYLVVGVAAVDADNQKSGFSNYGADCVDVAAPGEDILSLRYYDPNSDEFYDLEYSSWDGTSFSTALISGVAALVKSAHPDWTPAQVSQALIDTAMPLDPRLRGRLGSGLVDAAAAVGTRDGVSAPDNLEGATELANQKIKLANQSAVYYVDSNGRKHLFANEATYWTWYTGTWPSQTIKSLSQTEFDALPTGANIVARPGSLIRFDNSPQLYVVGDRGSTSIISDQVARTWYGSSNQMQPRIIQSAFEANYVRDSTVITESSVLGDFETADSTPIWNL